MSKYKNGDIIKSIFGKIIYINASNIDDYINKYNESLEDYKLRDLFLKEPYQQIVDEFIKIKNDNNW